MKKLTFNVLDLKGEKIGIIQVDKGYQTRFIMHDGKLFAWSNINIAYIESAFSYVEILTDKTIE